MRSAYTSDYIYSLKHLPITYYCRQSLCGWDGQWSDLCMGPCEQPTATSSATWSLWSNQCDKFQCRWYDDTDT